MFRITRGIIIDHAPAFPNPALRYPDGTPLPIYHEDEHPETSEAEDQPTNETTDASSLEAGTADAPHTDAASLSG